MSEAAYQDRNEPVQSTSQPDEAVSERAARTTPTAGTTTGDFSAGGTDSMADSWTNDMDRFRRSWESIQVGFVDDPHRAVQEAAALIEEVSKELTAGLRRDTDRLAAGGDGAGQTEAMRRAFTRYRDFFDRLLRIPA